MTLQSTPLDKARKKHIPLIHIFLYPKTLPDLFSVHTSKSHTRAFELSLESTHEQPDQKVCCAHHISYIYTSIQAIFKKAHEGDAVT